MSYVNFIFPSLSTIEVDVTLRSFEVDTISCAHENGDGEMISSRSCRGSSYIVVSIAENNNQTFIRSHTTLLKRKEHFRIITTEYMAASP